MSQKQCPWCGALGARYESEQVGAGAEYAPHYAGGECVCRHVSAHTRRGAKRQHGRYYDAAAQKWLCFGCETA